MRGALAFLTVLGRARPPGRWTLEWFPVVGAALGLGVGGVWWLAARAFPPLVAAALTVGADLVLTGLLHFDGLVDSADGLLCTAAPAERLRVMATPEAGAFGVAAAGAVLLARFAALASLRPAVVLVGGLWCLSRSLMVGVVRAGRYARGAEGMAGAFLHPGPPWIALPGVAGAAALCALWRIGPGLAAAGVALVAGMAVVGLAYRRIGGYTGDVLGASAVVAETAGLVVAAARW